MDFDHIMVKESPGLCRCCLSEGCYKDLGTEYTWMSDTEVYADMLLECFDISITQHNEGPNGPNRLICEVCITRLRDACNFKKQVLESEKKFIDMVGRGEFRPKVLIYQGEMKTEEQVEESMDEPEAEYLEEDTNYADDDIAKDEAEVEESSTYEDITVSTLPVKGKRGRPRKNATIVKTDKKAKVSKIEEKPKTSKAVAKDNMSRVYQRKTTRQSWSQESMRNAIEAVQKNRMGWQLASKTFGVPQATLRRHALNTNKELAPNTKGLGRFKLTFPPEIERQFVEHLKFLETRLFGLTRSSVQELAFNFADKNGMAHSFNKEKKRAGQEWLDGFLKRNKHISLRAPEPTSAARAQSFNKPQISKFFEIYQELLDSHNLGPHEIYNMAETGLITFDKPQTKIATKGRKQIGCLTSVERGSNVTVICCTNAIGSYVPPCMIFPRKNMKNELVDAAPTGTLGLAQEFGWMNAEIFVKWLRHFQTYTKCSKDNSVLLICDGHASHKTIEALNYAKYNGIFLLGVPPHCTHRMQPIDVSIYGPLKTHFHEEISNWLKNHRDRVVTHLQIGYLFNQAYGKTATVENACNGFKSTGVWPINKDIFPDCMFESPGTLNIPLVDHNRSDIGGETVDVDPLESLEEDIIADTADNDAAI